MGETRKIATILVADIVGYSRLAGTDGSHTVAAAGAAQRSDRSGDQRALHGRIVKRTGDGRFSSSFAAWSTPCAARSKCRTE